MTLEIKFKDINLPEIQKELIHILQEYYDQKK